MTRLAKIAALVLCKTCDGTGGVVVTSIDDDRLHAGSGFEVEAECPDCGGSGVRVEQGPTSYTLIGEDGEVVYDG